jgi:DNA-binding phage protein
MSDLIENPRDHTIAHLNRILKLDGPVTFQKVLFDIALSHQSLASVAEQVGVRRETVWRYKTGACRAPFETLVKLIGVIGAKFVIVHE